MNLSDMVTPPDMTKIVSIKTARVIYMDPEEAERQERLAQKKKKIIYKTDLNPEIE